jgi:hypothetical protein
MTTVLKRFEWYPFWLEVWNRDDPFRFDQEVFIELDTWGFLWVDKEEGFTQSTEERLALLSKVRSDPDRYLRVPPLRHGDHHVIFSEFLAFLPKDVTDMCNPASFGGFLGDMARYFPDSAERVEADWHSFHDDALQLYATAWFHRIGFDVVWGW